MRKIGTLTIGDKVAILGENGWECQDKGLEKFLNAAYNLTRYSPADGIRGWRLLREAAEESGGQARFEPPPKEDPNAVY